MRNSLVAALLWLFIALPVPAEEAPLRDAAKEAQARELFHAVRCQVCQGQSIADSNAELARSMRLLIREEVEAGQPREAILERLVKEYGDSILMKPPVNSLTLGLWNGPFLIFLLMLGGMIIWFRRHGKRP